LPCAVNLHLRRSVIAGSGEAHGSIEGLAFRILDFMAVPDDFFYIFRAFFSEVALDWPGIDADRGGRDRLAS
jgi:hypothetical protein